MAKSSDDSAGIWSDAAKRVIAWFVRALFWIGGLLPERVLLLLSRAGGSAVWYLARRRRQIILRNLDIAFRDSISRDEKSRIGRLSCQHVARCAAAMALHRRWDEPAFTERVSKDATTDAILRRGSERAPIAVITSHIGDWEIGQFLFQQLGIPLAAVARHLHNPHLNRYLNQMRERRGGLVSNREVGRIRDLLRSGHSVAFLADQNDRRRMYFADFFGVPASSYIGYAKILLRARCSVVFIACLVDPSAWRFQLVSRELVSGEEAPERWTPAELSRRAGALVDAYLRETEALVRAHPEQYFWMHRRWKSRPPGSPKLYEDLDRPLSAETLERAIAAGCGSP